MCVHLISQCAVVRVLDRRAEKSEREIKVVNVAIIRKRGENVMKRKHNAMDWIVRRRRKLYVVP